MCIQRQIKGEGGGLVELGWLNWCRQMPSTKIARPSLVEGLFILVLKAGGAFGPQCVMAAIPN